MTGLILLLDCSSLNNLYVNLIIIMLVCMERIENTRHCRLYYITTIASIKFHLLPAEKCFPFYVLIFNQNEFFTWSCPVLEFYLILTYNVVILALFSRLQGQQALQHPFPNAHPPPIPIPPHLAMPSSGSHGSGLLQLSSVINAHSHANSEKDKGELRSLQVVGKEVICKGIEHEKSLSQLNRNRPTWTILEMTCRTDTVVT